jgi:hypothetical protein
MAGTSREATSYDEAREAVLKSLRELASTLADHLRRPFKYRLVSQAQAGPFEREYYVWAKSGGVGAPPTFDAASARASIYNQAAAARQLEAFLHVSRVVAFELCQAGIRGFEAKEVAVPCMMLRSLLERTAHAGALGRALKPLTQASPQSDTLNRPLLEVADKISKALYGTKVDWQKLLNVNPRTVSNDDIAYARKDLTMDVSARSVLSSIDKLDKRIPGTRIAYDVLCEFLHPNVGDLYSATVGAYSHIDYYGTRHLIRELGLGPKELSSTPDLERILSQVLTICSEAIRILPLAFDDLKTESYVANKLAKKFAHRVRKRYRSYFQKNDLCPCLSGLRIRDCK